MTLSDQHPRIFICSTTYYVAFPHAFLSSDTLLLKNGTLSLTQRLKFLAPTIAPQNSNFSLSSDEKKYNFDVYPQLHLRPQGYSNPGTWKGPFRHFMRVSDAWELTQHH